MTAWPAFAALLSHWKRSPLQLLTLIAGLALATALWSGVQAINAEARASYNSAADQTRQGRYPRIVSLGAAITTKDYVALRRAGWPVSPQIQGVLATPNGTVDLIGIDPLTLPPDAALHETSGTLDPALFLGTEEHAVASPDAARLLADMPLAVTEEPRLSERTALVDIAVAQRLLARADTLDRLLITANVPDTAPALSSIAPHLTRIEINGASDIARLTDSFHLNLTAFGLLSFAVGLFIVYGAIGLAFEQRRAMFRTLRALGLSLNTLIVLLAAELLVLATLAGAIGVVLGYIIAAALLPDVAATLRGLYGADVAGTLQIRASWWASGLAIALGGTLLAGTGTLWRLSRLSLLDAGTPQAWAQGARRVMLGMAVTGAGLLALAAGLAWNAQGLIQGFTILGCLLIGAALLLPVLLDQILRALANVARPPLPQWFWADTRSQIPGLSMALMALLLAIAANVGVSTMVSSFRLTFTGWLDQRLASELYITTANPEQARQVTSALTGKVDAILPIVKTDARIAGQAGEIYAVADHATYRDNWPILSGTNDLWSKLHVSGHALINEQLALRNGLRIGDNTPDTYGDEIVGIYSDYGNPSPQIITGLASFETRYPDIQATRFGLRLPAAETTRITTLLQTELGLPSDAIRDQAQIKKVSIGIFEQTFTVTSALNVLTLSIAAFSILMSLLTLSQMRLPQLAPVWALGLTRLQLSRLELLRAVALAALVTVLAIPLGLALAWVLLAVVNVAAFGWRLPMFLFPAAYLWLCLAALLAALVAAAWPALALSRIAPHRLLQVFSAGR